MAATLQELVEGKTTDQLKGLANDLKGVIEEREKAEEEAKAKELRKDITLDQDVYFLLGKGKDSKVTKGTVTQITQSGITAMTDNGQRVSRRFKKLLTPEQVEQMQEKKS